MALRFLAQVGGRRVPRHRDAPPDFARREVAGQRDGATEMIGIAVGDRQIVEADKASGAEHRTDDAIADVEAAADRRAAGVHDERAAVGKRHQRGIALADVNHRQVEPPVASRADTRLGSRDDPQEHRGCHDQANAAATRPTFTAATTEQCGDQRRVVCGDEPRRR